MRLLEDVALQQRDADVDVQRTESAHDDPPAIAAEAQRARRATAGRRAERTVFQVTHFDRLIDPLSDDSSTETGDPTDLGPRRGVAGSHHIDDAKQTRHFVGLCAETQSGLCCHGAIFAQDRAVSTDVTAAIVAIRAT